MTRLTNALRDTIFGRIMKGLPNRNYETEMHTVIQATVAEFMDPRVRAVYDDEKLRPILNGCDVRISVGNRNIYLYHSAGGRYIYGLLRQLEIRTADIAWPERIPEGGMYHHLLFKTNLVELANAHFAQEELREQVRKRLRANLSAATTIKKLYDVLEPELHSFIPVIVEGSANLPACVAPVVDDLKKLGLAVPEVPKAAAAQPSA